MPTLTFTPVWVTVWVTPPYPRKNILKKFGKQEKTADFLRNQRRFGCGGRNTVLCATIDSSGHWDAAGGVLMG